MRNSNRLVVLVVNRPQHRGSDWCGTGAVDVPTVGRMNWPIKGIKDFGTRWLCLIRPLFRLAESAEFPLSSGILSTHPATSDRIKALNVPLILKMRMWGRG